ncbi:MAG: gliding motility-associated C-terminal domain-containing protein [Saprospiraceae bacterium]|nr:gliding motility-associated C-terminal domain-containing protein [Saprospiraceae bacterium]
MNGTLSLECPPCTGVRRYLPQCRRAVLAALVYGVGLAAPVATAGQCNEVIDWAVWENFNGNSATGTITSGGQTFEVTMNANYTFDYTNNIYNYGAFAGFNGPLPPNATVPRTTWAAGQGGETTMCFSEVVTNPVLLISSLGSPSIVVTLEFSLPYTVLYDGGGMTFPNNTTVIGQEGYAILVFPGDFECVTIYSDTPENYTNITWGLNPPPFEVEIEGDTVGCVSTTLTASGGVTYVWSGGANPNSPVNTFTESGSYIVTVTDAAGCTAVAAVTVEIYPEFETIMAASICEGDAFFFEGQYLTEPGYYDEVLFSQHGCDSVVYLDLTVHPLYFEELFAEICEGDFYPFGPDALTTTGDYQMVLPDQYGCDSTRILHLVVHPSRYTDISAQICQGESYAFDGQSLQTSGFYTAYFPDQYGCDSTVVLSLEVFPSMDTSWTISICPGEQVVFQGDTLTQAGLYTASLVNQYGCDSTIALTIETRDADTTAWEASICEGGYFVHEGDTLSSAGIYPVVLTGEEGCDSLVVLTLTVEPVYQLAWEVQICAGQSHVFQGDTLVSSGQYEVTYQSGSGCDSTITLDLSVVAAIETHQAVSICFGDSVYFDGQYFHDPGWYRDTLTSAGGCDSVAVLELSVKSLSSGEETVWICEGEGYIFNGQWLQTAGTYTALFSDFNGCDSLATLHLHVHEASPVQWEAQICEGEVYSFDGQLLSQSGIYTAQLTSSSGCDSIVELTLTVTDLLMTHLAVTICEGEMYPFGGQWLEASGTYTDTLVSIGGCDSLVFLQLTEMPVWTDTLSMQICEGEGVEFGGEWIDASGEYVHWMESGSGCDSVEVLQLHVQPGFVWEEMVHSCDAYTWPVTGITYEESGDVEANFITANGCDSIYRLHLVISPSYTFHESVAAKRLYTWSVNGTTYTQSGQYVSSGLTVQGCDSVYLLDLMIEGGGQIYVPNAFSPDEDGINDHFTIFADDSVRRIVSLSVYDRWGNFLDRVIDFPPSDPRYGWNGQSRGALMDPGVYVFTVLLDMEDDTQIFLSGEVMVIR